MHLMGAWPLGAVSNLPATRFIRLSVMNENWNVTVRGCVSLYLIFHIIQWLCFMLILINIHCRETGTCFPCCEGYGRQLWIFFPEHCQICPKCCESSFHLLMSKVCLFSEKQVCVLHSYSILHSCFSNSLFISLSSGINLKIGLLLLGWDLLEL